MNELSEYYDWFWEKDIVGRYVEALFPAIENECRMKVLQMVKTSEGAGWVSSLAEALQERGVDVTVALPYPQGRLVQSLKRKRIKYVLMPVNISSFKEVLLLPWSIFRLVRYLRQERFDIVHYHLFASIIIGRIAAFWACTPVRISMIAGPLHLEFGPTRMIDCLASWMDTKIIASSQATRDIYLRMGIPREKIGLVYYGADESGFLLKESAGRKIREEFGINGSAALVGMVAHFYAPKAYFGVHKFGGKGIKGDKYFIDAAKKVLRVIPQTRFLLVGKSWGKKGERYRQRLIQYTNSLGLDKEIIFTGFREDVADILASLDVSVQCSLSDNLGGTIESLMMQLPTIATRVGGFPDIIIDGKTGLLVPAADSAALAQAIIRLIRNKELGQRLASEGRRFACQRFSLTRTVQDIYNLYLELYNKAKKVTA